MLILRLVGALALITIGIAFVLYLFTRNRRLLAFGQAGKGLDLGKTTQPAVD